MIGNITLGQYIPGDSVLHKLDSRTKIIWTGVLMILVFMMETWVDYAFVALLTICLLSISRVPVGQSLKGLKPLLWILAITSIINILIVPGREIWSWGPFTVTIEGIMASLKVFFRLGILVIIASLITLTTTPMSMTDGLEKMMNPLKRIKVPVHEIAMMMSIALRFIPTLLEETERIMKAQASRGADFDTGNLAKRVRSFIPVLVPLFVSAFKRADELAEAMESRCYRGGEGRTRLRKIRFTAVDAKASLVMGAYLAVMLAVHLVMR